MTTLSTILLLIYKEIIVLGPEFFNFVAVVLFIVFITNLLGQSVQDFVNNSKLTQFDLLSKSKLAQSSDVIESLEEVQLIEEISLAVEDLTSETLSMTYNYNPEYYFLAEHIATLSSSSSTEAYLLASLTSSLYDSSSEASDISGLLTDKK